MDEHRYRAAEERLWRSIDRSPDEHWIRLEQIDCAVRVQATGDGPPVLFIHGVLNAGSGWTPMVDLLGDYRCLLVDRPGCGLSDPLPAPLRNLAHFETYADRFVADVLDGLGLDRAHVISTNQGGYLALRGAAAHPDRFDRLVQVGWTVGAPVARIPFGMRVGTSLGRIVMALPPTRAAVRSLFRQIGLGPALAKGDVSEEGIDWYLSLLRDTPTVQCELESGPQLVRPVRGMDPRVLLEPELLASVQTRCLFLWGEDDLFGGPDTARPFVDQIPGAILQVLPGTGHAPWVDHPDCVSSTVRSFLAAG